MDDLNVVIAAIHAQLDAAAANLPITRQQLSYLPDADHFSIVDLAVRQWATLRKGRLVEHERHDRRPDGTGVECYSVKVDGSSVWSIVTVHRPRELQKVADPRPLEARCVADAEGM